MIETDFSDIYTLTLEELKGDPSNLRKLGQFWREQGVPDICERCPGIISEAFYNFKSIINMTKTTKPATASTEAKGKQERSYLLKKGAMIQIIGHGTRYTNANLTDEIARGLLLKYPQFLSQFESYPKDEVSKILKGKAEAKAEPEAKAEAKAEPEVKAEVNPETEISGEGK